MQKGLVVMCVAGLFLGLGPLAAQPQKAGAAASADVKIIQVAAKRYVFSPAMIRVKKGTRVQLRVRALDRTHGLSISLYAEDAEPSGPPGLQFDPPQSNWKLEKDQERLIEFVAVRPGTYPFKCSTFCGLGHFEMKGKLIVEY